MAAGFAAAFFATGFTEALGAGFAEGFTALAAGLAGAAFFAVAAFFAGTFFLLPYLIPYCLVINTFVLYSFTSISSPSTIEA